MTLDLRKYLKESYKENKYKIKSVVPLDNDKIKKMEVILDRYKLVNLSEVFETAIEKEPLDFNNVKNRSVFIVTATTLMPVAPTLLHQQLKDELGIPENYLVVLGENDPSIEYTEILNDESEYETKMSTDPDYNDDEVVKGDPEFGDKYNDNLLNYLEQTRNAIGNRLNKGEFNSHVSKYGNYTDEGAKQLKDGK